MNLHSAVISTLKTDQKGLKTPEIAFNIVRHLGLDKDMEVNRKSLER